MKTVFKTNKNNPVTFIATVVSYTASVLSLPKNIHFSKVRLPRMRWAKTSIPKFSKGVQNFLKAIVSTAAALLFFTVVFPAASNAVAYAPTDQLSHYPSQSVQVDATAASPLIARDTYGITGPPKPKTDIVSYKNLADTFVNASTSPIQYPFRMGVQLSDGFGPRVAPCDKCSTIHMGQDFVPGEGSQIQVIADGIVTQVVNDNVSTMESDTGGFGTYVVIQHNIDGQNVTSFYAHLLYQSSPLVIGQHVSVGDLLGSVGNTGHSTGAHLHFEIRVNGTPVDPMVWLAAHNH